MHRAVVVAPASVVVQVAQVSRNMLGEVQEAWRENDRRAAAVVAVALVEPRLASAVRRIRLKKKTID